MSFEELLEANSKGVLDLLHHELSELSLAHTLACLPDAEEAIREVETLLYKRVVQIVEGVFEQILASLALEESLAYPPEAMRQSVQLFVNERTKEVIQNLRTKVRWWQARR